MTEGRAVEDGGGLVLGVTRERGNEDIFIKSSSFSRIMLKINNIKTDAKKKFQFITIHLLI